MSGNMCNPVDLIHLMRSYSLLDSFNEVIQFIRFIFFRIYDRAGEGFITMDTLRGLISELLAPLSEVLVKIQLPFQRYLSKYSFPIRGILQNITYLSEAFFKTQLPFSEVFFKTQLPFSEVFFKNPSRINWGYPTLNEGFLELLQQSRSSNNIYVKEELDGIIEELDEDGSGTMDFDEFCEMMMPAPVNQYLPCDPGYSDPIRKSWIFRSTL